MNIVYCLSIVYPDDFVSPNSVLSLALYSPYVSYISPILLSFSTKWNLTPRSEASETVHSIIFIFGMLFRYGPGVMPVFLEF